MKITIDNRPIGKDYPVYFIADIASNHGGNLEKAKELIHACAESRVDAVKMQNFSAETIVSDYGFKNLSNVKTHQSAWKTSVFDSYKAASIPFEWTLELKELAKSLNMAYFTSPYSIELVKAVAPYVSAFKLGSGDLTWHEEIEEMTKYDKPIIISTGASDLKEVKAAVEVGLSKNGELLLLQCNTNYSAHHGEPEDITRERFSNLNIRVLGTYGRLFPGVPLGLSDHTHGSDSVLGAVGLFDASAIEKHFTFDSSLEGQDHAFSMMPNEWLKMVEKTEHLKTELKPDQCFKERYEITRKLVSNPEHLALMLGTGIKEIQENEQNTIIVQRRSIQASRDLKVGEVLNRKDLIVLRPCPKDGLPPYRLSDVVGKKLNRSIVASDYLKISDIE